MDMTPEEILRKHTGLFSLRLPGVYRTAVLSAMREYGELKQPPRWVKASERLPDFAGWKITRNVPEDLGSVSVLYFLDGQWYDDSGCDKNNVTDGMFTSCEWLDESESPKEEAELVKLAFSEGYDSATHHENFDKSWKEFQKEHLVEPQPKEG